MFEHFKSLELNNSNNQIKYEHDNHDFLYHSIQYQSVSTLFSTLPENYSFEKLNECIFQYPSLSRNLIDYFISNLTNENINIVISLSNQIILHYYDFIMLLLHQKSFFIFLSKLLPFTISINDKQQFEPLWNLSLTLIRITWGFGWEELNNQILTFIEGISNISIVYYLKILINDSPPHFTPPKSSKSPFFECIHVYQQLMENSTDLQTQITKSHNKNYLWTSILLFCLNQISPEMKLIEWGTPYSTPINDLFFFHLMILITNPICSWRTSLQYPDYPFTLIHYPDDISEINSVLFDQFDLLIGVIPITFSIINKIIIIWRTWCQKYGLNQLTKSIIRQLIWKSAHISNTIDAKFLFQTVGFLISIVSNQSHYDFIDIELVIEEIIDNDVENTAAAEALAHFSLVIILGSHLKWTELIQKLLSKCISIFDQNNSNQSQTRLIFALTIVRCSIHNKSFRKYIPDEMAKALYNIGALTSLIDFYITDTY